MYMYIYLYILHIYVYICCQKDRKFALTFITNILMTPL